MRTSKEGKKKCRPHKRPANIALKLLCLYINTDSNNNTSAISKEKGESVVMTEFKTISKDLTNCNHLSGYELTHATIHNLNQYDLTPTAKLVLVLLTTHYNHDLNGAVVFPSMSYISETLGIGLTAVKQAIKDLIQEGLIIKAKRNRVRGNCNKYLLTQKVQNPTLKQSKSDFFKQSDSDRFMITNNMEQIKKTTTCEKTEKTEQKNVVAFNPNSKKSVKPADVPEIIKNNKKVQNPCAYWASLDEDVKKEYLRKQKEKDEKARKIVELKKMQQLKKQKEQEELECIKNEPPFWRTCTRAQAVEHLQHFLKMPKLLHSGYRLDLIRKFDISMNELHACK